MIARYKPYSEYKLSGVEWLGDVPEHWSITLVQNVATLVNGFPFDSKIFDPELGFPLVRIRDLNQEKTEACYNGEFVPAASITSNDVLIGMDGDFNVGKWLGDGLGLLNQRMCCLRGKTKTISRLLEYGLSAPLHIINDITYATTVKHLSSYQIAKIKFPLAPFEEQRAIASFLDRETGAIDRLIGKQERMIQLLKEKRQAVISHAVSARKDDKQAKLAFFVNLLPGYAFKSDDFITEPTSTKLLRGINVGVGRTKWDEAVYFEDDTTVNAFRLKAGDLVLGMDRPWIKEGARIAMISDEDLPCLLVQRVARLRAINGLQQDYLRLQMQSKRFQNYVETDLTGVSVPHLSPDQIMGFRIPVLTDAEQTERAGTVRRMEEKFQQLTAKAEQAIELMKERRTALISAAVTGKIDVRESGNIEY